MFVSRVVRRFVEKELTCQDKPLARNRLSANEDT